MAEHRHKRDTDARRKPRAAIVAAPLALLATAGAVTIGVLASRPRDRGNLLAKDAADISSVAPRDHGRAPTASPAPSRVGPRLGWRRRRSAATGWS